MKNERTSKRGVAPIAAKVLAYDHKVAPATLDETLIWMTGLKWRDLRALAASALTQTPNKPKPMKNEHTSKKVAALAGKYLKLTQSKGAVDFYNAVIGGNNREGAKVLAELRMIFASCLTQAPGKPKKRTRLTRA